MSLATAFWSSASSLAMRATCSLGRFGSAAAPDGWFAPAAGRGESAVAGCFPTSAQPARLSATIAAREKLAEAEGRDRGAHGMFAVVTDTKASGH